MTTVNSGKLKQATNAALIFRKKKIKLKIVVIFFLFI